MSGKTNGIVIEAKMRAGWRQKLLKQEADWRETVYAGVSVISMTSAKTFSDKKKSADNKNLLIESADNKICWQNLLRRNFFLHNLPKKSKTANDGKILKYLLSKKS